MKIKFVAIVLLLSAVGQAQASFDSQYIDLARTRKYLGGADEADLKVQPNLKQSSKSNKKQPEQNKKPQRPVSSGQAEN